MGTSVTNMPALPPIEVHRHGCSGPPLVVLHGGPGAPGSVGALARDLSAFGCVWEPRQRRSGEVPLTVERHVLDLAVVMPGPAAIIGWSWGAMLALSFAAARPELASAIVLVGCGTYDEAGRRAYERAMTERLGQAGRARMTTLRDELARADQQAARDRSFAELGRIAGRAQAFEPIESDDIVEVDADGFAETWADVVRRQRSGLEPSSFAGIDCPALLVHGDHDPHPGPAIRDVLRLHLPQLEYLEIPRCGHAPWLERHGRESFLDALHEWLGRMVEPADVGPSRA